MTYNAAMMRVSFHIIVSVCVSILVYVSMYVHLCKCVCMQHVYMLCVWNMCGYEYVWVYVLYMCMHIQCAAC